MDQKQASKTLSCWRRSSEAWFEPIRFRRCEKPSPWRTASLWCSTRTEILSNGQYGPKWSKVGLQDLELFTSVVRALLRANSVSSLWKKPPWRTPSYDANLEQKHHQTNIKVSGILLTWNCSWIRNENVIKSANHSKWKLGVIFLCKNMFLTKTCKNKLEVGYSRFVLVNRLRRNWDLPKRMHSDEFFN